MDKILSHNSFSERNFDHSSLSAASFEFASTSMLIPIKLSFVEDDASKQKGVFCP